MRAFIQDLRHGTRMLLRKPGFTAVAVLTLALGIGANTAIFSVVNAVLLRPLPYEDSQRLVMVWEKRPKLNRVRNPVSFPDFLDWRTGNQSFEQMAAYTPAGFNLTGAGEPERVAGAAVTPDLFPLLRVQAGAGRTFLPEEEVAGRDLVVLLSDGLWRQRFGSDPEIVGKTITLNGAGRTVVGIMPPSFGFPGADARLWVPLAPKPDDAGNRGMHYLQVIARVKPGMTLDQARADMDGVAGRLEQAYPVNTGHGVNVFDLHDEIVGKSKLVLFVLSGAVGFVLLIACANVANLLLANTTGRHQELAIRLALGAGRWRIVRQMMTESVLLGALGGALGLLLALWGVDALVAASWDNVPRASEIHSDASVLLFTLTISILTGLLFGVIPALAASRLDLNSSLKEGGAAVGGSRRNHARTFFVVSQVALSLVLLIGAGLTTRSFAKLLNVSSGFRPENVLAVDVNLSGGAYREDHRRIAFYRESLQRIQALPGVESAATVINLPLVGYSSRYFRIEGRPPQPQGQGLNASNNIVSPGYFHTMGIPVRQGRDFTDGDSVESMPVVIINAAMSRRFWPDEDPVGGRLAVGDEPWRTIVGVVGDVRSHGLDSEPQPEMYYPHFQIAFGSATLVIRTVGDPLVAAPSVRSVVHAIDRDLPVSGARSMEQVLADSVASFRFNMLLLLAFATVAIVLAVVGIYGITSYSVSQRTREIGIRMALGAFRRDVLILILRQVLAASCAGIAIGLAGAFALTRVMSSLLFEVSATDLSTFTVVPLVLLCGALAGSYLPALRATRVDPMAALRHE